MKKRFGFVLILLSITLVSCGNSKKISTGKEDPVIKKGIIITDWTEYERSAETKITKVVLASDTLSIDVSYSGGCEEHEFELLGSKDVMKSMPPKRAIVLYHDSHNDTCRELISETLKFDISDFSTGSNGTIHLNLDGWNELIIYSK